MIDPTSHPASEPARPTLDDLKDSYRESVKAAGVASRRAKAASGTDNWSARLNEWGAYRVVAAKALAELRRRVETGEAGTSWKSDWWGWFRRHLPRQDRAIATELLRLAKADAKNGSPVVAEIGADRTIADAPAPQSPVANGHASPSEAPASVPADGGGERSPIVIVKSEEEAARLKDWSERSIHVSDPSELNGHLGGEDVVIVVPNDGFEHYVHQIGAALAGQAKRISLLMLSETGGNASDWIRAGGTREKFHALIAEARDWTPPPPPDPVAEAEAKARAEAEEKRLVELARMGPLEYARSRRDASERFGINVGDVDRAVSARRRELEAAVADPPLGSWWDPLPWADEVDGATLIADLVTYIRRFSVITEEQGIAIALWVLFSWVHDVARHSPVLLLTSGVDNEGKSLLLTIIAYLARRGFLYTEGTAANFYQDADRWAHTPCIDEGDDAFKGALVSIINARWLKSTAHTRKGGTRGKAKGFTTWCAIAVGMIGRKMPASTLGRCIVIEVRQELPTDKREGWDYDPHGGEIAGLRQRCRRWAMDNMKDLKLPTKTTGRYWLNNSDKGVSDNWAMQVAIADLAGGKWPELARNAEGVVTKEGRSQDDMHDRIKLLADIEYLFERERVTKFHSETLVGLLKGLEDRPWGQWQGKGLSKWQLADLLKPFKVYPASVKIGGVVLGGYQLAWFKEDAFVRYHARMQACRRPPPPDEKPSGKRE